MVDEFSYVVSSKNRTKVLKSLELCEKTPKIIADELKMHKSTVSFTLGELKDYNLVICINPEVKKGRLYKLTDVGEKVLIHLNKPVYNFNF